MASPQAKREAVSIVMTERDYGVTRLRAAADLTIAVSVSTAQACVREVVRAHQGDRRAETAPRYRRSGVRLRREG